MPALHLVERKNQVRPVAEAEGEWESGYWVVSENAATRLVGGDLYLHGARSVPSHFGGRIVGWRVVRDGSQVDGRIAFRIRPSPAHQGVVTDAAGWGREKKYCW